MDKYAVNQSSVNTLLSWVESGTIAIPEIQRPFVWSTTQVRNLMDSFYKGYPVGYIITWQNPDVKLKNGQTSHGKKIMIDGQQRVTALRAAVLGFPVIDKTYKEKRIFISFNPANDSFATRTATTKNNPEWIEDISVVMKTGFDVLTFVDEYVAKNPDCSRQAVNQRLNQLIQIKNKQIGEIQLSPNLDINVVNEIFVRINASGVNLSNADFAMSKIAVYEREAGDEFGMNLRKFIDYFCHLAIAPQQYKFIAANDSKFAHTDYFSKIAWLTSETDDLYDLTYNDVIRIIGLTQFSRGKIGDIVALLSGRDFETRTNSKEIADQSFVKLEKGMYQLSNANTYRHFVQDILRSSGYDEPSMLSARNAINYAYAMYLRLLEVGENRTDINRSIRRLLAISHLTARHSGSFETRFEQDIKIIQKTGDIQKFINRLQEQELSDVFWRSALPDELDKVNVSNPFWHIFVAAQKKLLKDSFLTSENKVKDMTTGDIHHIFPKNYLVKNGYDKSQYNKIANFVYLRNDINIAVSDQEPRSYLKVIIDGNGRELHSNIGSRSELLDNFAQNAIPSITAEATHEDYEVFMRERRELMAELIRKYYESL